MAPEVKDQDVRTAKTLTQLVCRTPRCMANLYSNFGSEGRKVTDNHFVPTWFLLLGLLLGVVASVLGYIGCFSVVQSAQKSSALSAGSVRRPHCPSFECTYGVSIFNPTTLPLLNSSWHSTISRPFPRATSIKNPSMKTKSCPSLEQTRRSQFSTECVCIGCKHTQSKTLFLLRLRLEASLEVYSRALKQNTTTTYIIYRWSDSDDDRR